MINKDVKENELTNPVPNALKLDGNNSPTRTNITGPTPPENPVYIRKIAITGIHLLKG